MASSMGMPALRRISCEGRWVWVGWSHDMRPVLLVFVGFLVLISSWFVVWGCEIEDFVMVLGWVVGFLGGVLIFAGLVGV